ncbi:MULTISPECIES: arginase family protein [unclassified Ruegeria]|uniref:arginase family protein n=1 Tax=unclassified Ruegeria TaxID=2625375 RepID=UPI00148943E8|nr:MULTISPECIES: arginase family protein [unclassified Ruegeria]
MPLRSAPLPRMAGHLSFMRAQTKAIRDVRPGDLAVLGVPFEDTSAPHAGQSLAPRALRETSVYFGWHANPQFSHPVDIDARQDISTDGLHQRLCDLGDISPGSEDAIHAALGAATRQISRNGACAVILGGSDCLSETVQSALPECQTAQLGGTPNDARDFQIAPLPNGGGTACNPDTAAQLAAFSKWRDVSKPLFVRFDLSVFETSLSALCDRPRLGGCDLETVVQWLELLGQHEVSAIMLTGLNPNRPGMGVVKVGQRLMVTALLAFIYARLGFGIDHPGRLTSKENVLT